MFTAEVRDFENEIVPKKKRMHKMNYVSVFDDFLWYPDIY